MEEQKRGFIFPWRQVVALCCILLVALIFSLDREQTQLAEKLVRLHVLANSDSQEDQSLKLKVRDRILEVTEPCLEGTTDSAGAANTLRANLGKLETAAQEVVQAEGYSYPVSVRMEQTWFPTRDYESFSLPAGQYEALRVVIGEGSGHNWWCVVFPPLCLASASERIVETAGDVGLSEEEVSLIAEQDEGYVIKFKAMECWETLKAKLQNSVNT